MISRGLPPDFIPNRASGGRKLVCPAAGLVLALIGTGIGWSGLRTAPAPPAPFLPSAPRPRSFTAHAVLRVHQTPDAQVHLLVMRSGSLTKAVCVAVEPSSGNGLSLPLVGRAFLLTPEGFHTTNLLEDGAGWESRPAGPAVSLAPLFEILGYIEPWRTLESLQRLAGNADPASYAPFSSPSQSGVYGIRPGRSLFIASGLPYDRVDVYGDPGGTYAVVASNPADGPVATMTVEELHSVPPYPPRRVVVRDREGRWPTDAHVRVGVSESTERPWKGLVPTRPGSRETVITYAIQGDGRVLPEKLEFRTLQGVPLSTVTVSVLSTEEQPSSTFTPERILHGFPESVDLALLRAQLSLQRLGHEGLPCPPDLPEREDLAARLPLLNLDRQRDSAEHLLLQFDCLDLNVPLPALLKAARDHARRKSGPRLEELADDVRALARFCEARYRDPVANSPRPSPMERARRDRMLDLTLALNALYVSCLPQEPSRRLPSAETAYREGDYLLAYSASREGPEAASPRAVTLRLLSACGAFGADARTWPMLERGRLLRELGSVEGPARPVALRAMALLEEPGSSSAPFQVSDPADWTLLRGAVRSALAPTLDAASRPDPLAGGLASLLPEIIPANVGSDPEADRDAVTRSLTYAGWSYLHRLVTGTAPSSLLGPRNFAEEAGALARRLRGQCVQALGHGTSYEEIDRQTAAFESLLVRTWRNPYHPSFKEPVLDLNGFAFLSRQVFDAAARDLASDEGDGETRRTAVREAWLDVADLLHAQYWRRLMELDSLFVPSSLRFGRVLTRLARADLAMSEFQFLLLE